MVPVLELEVFGLMSCRTFDWFGLIPETSSSQDFYIPISKTALLQMCLNGRLDMWWAEAPPGDAGSDTAGETGSPRSCGLPLGRGAGSGLSCASRVGPNGALGVRGRRPVRRLPGLAALLLLLLGAAVWASPGYTSSELMAGASLAGARFSASHLCVNESSNQNVRP